MGHGGLGFSDVLQQLSAVVEQSEQVDVVETAGQQRLERVEQLLAHRKAHGPHRTDDVIQLSAVLPTPAQETLRHLHPTIKVNSIQVNSIH